MENSETTTPRSYRRWILITVSIIIGLTASYFALTYLLEELRPPEMHGMVMQSTDTVKNFTLDSADGKVRLSDFDDKIVLLYFGYTFCPDVCPATMVELKKAMDELGDDADKVQVIMVSIDPTRDTPEKLAAYVDHFHPSFIGLTGTDEEIAGIAIPLGIFYEAHEGSAESGYIIDHTATVAVIDKEGYLQMIYSFDTAGEDIAEDLRYLIRH